MSNWAKEHLRHEVLVGGISNMVFNGIIAWLLLKDGPNQAWQGSHSFVVDILATAFILPFIVALIVIPLQKSKLNKGKLQTMDLGPKSRLQSLVNRLPQSTFLNALVFGGCGLTVIAPLTIALLALFGVVEFTPMDYSIFKGVWAGIMAGILVIPMVMSALRHSNLNSALETA